MGNKSSSQPVARAGDDNSGGAAPSLPAAGQAITSAMQVIGMDDICYSLYTNG